MPCTPGRRRPADAQVPASANDCDRALCPAHGLGCHRVLPDLLDDLDLVQTGYAVVRLAAVLLPASADAVELPQCLVRRRGVCRHPIRDRLAEAADLAVELDHHRRHRDALVGIVRIGDGLRGLALPHLVRDAHVPAAHAAHDSADRDRGAAVALLFHPRSARFDDRTDPHLLPHDAALRGVDDEKLHRRGSTRDRAGRRNSRRLALAHHLRDRAAADPLRPGCHLPVHSHSDVERVPAGADHHQDPGHDAADRAVEIPRHDRRPRLRAPGGARGRHHHSADDRRPRYPQASRARLQLRHGTEIAVARIELVGLSKAFGSVVAVRNLSLTIEDGEFVVLVGPSGCGKTTTLRMIAGFIDASAGEIRIDGRVVNDLEPRDRGLGMVFQTHALFPHKTVMQNVEFGLRMKGMPAPERAQRVHEVAEMVHISHLLDKMPGECSGGEAQRVALARTLVTQPSTFLLDEPLSSLDAKLRRELRAECDRLHQALKRTFIYVTHDQEEAMALADRIVVMRAGEIVQVGTPMEIYSNPVNYFIADFFGSPSMNLVAGEVVRNNGVAHFRSALFDIPLPGRFKSVGVGKGTLGIRPEHVRINAGGKTDAALPVRLVEPLGKDTLLYFDAGTDRAFVAVSEGLSMADTQIGERLTLSLDERRMHLFDEQGLSTRGT